MATDKTFQTARPGARQSLGAGDAQKCRRWSLPLRAGDVLVYLACERLTEVLVYLMVVFSPWVFGSSQPWAVWVMNVAGYALGVMLLVKLVIRWVKGYRPARWGGEVGGQAVFRCFGVSVFRCFSGRLTAGLAVLTLAILAYCLVSALNARAVYDAAADRFTYFDNYVHWLPDSFDANRTWFAFWSYLGLACSFWAVRDWLLGKTAAEQRPERRESGSGGHVRMEFFPARLRRLFWLLAINGGLLGVEGIIQRLEGFREAAVPGQAANP